MANAAPASQQITERAGAWDKVTYGMGRRGELAFKVGRREIGHLHGDRVAHFNFASETWQQLMAQKRITEHPVFPGRVGPAARLIGGQHDVDDVISLMRINYDRLTSGAAGGMNQGEQPEEGLGSGS